MYNGFMIIISVISAMENSWRVNKSKSSVGDDDQKRIDHLY